MEKRYNILYFHSFYTDLDEITNYIKTQLNNVKVAKDLLNRVEKAIKDRQINPEAYEKYNSIKKRKDTYYRIYVKNYTIFYTVKDNTMEIRRMLYGRRNFKRLI